MLLLACNVVSVMHVWQHNLLERSDISLDSRESQLDRARSRRGSLPPLHPALTGQPLTPISQRQSSSGEPMPLYQLYTPFGNPCSSQSADLAAVRNDKPVVLMLVCACMESCSNMLLRS